MAQYPQNSEGTEFWSETIIANEDVLQIKISGRYCLMQSMEDMQHKKIKLPMNVEK